MNCYSSLSIFSAGERASRESGLFVARYCRSIFSLSLTAFVGLVAVSPAWSLTVTAPENTVVAAGRDYATEVLADPWDFDGPGDIDIFELRQLTNPTFSGGVLRATTTGADSNIWMIFQGVPSAFNLTRGALYPIDNSRYTHLSLKMRLSMNNGSELPGSNRQMDAFFYEDENAIPDKRFGRTDFNRFPDNQWHIISIDLTDPDNIGNNSNFLWTDFPQIEGFRIDPSGSLAGVDVELDWARLTRDPGADTEVTVAWTDASAPVDIFAVDGDDAALLLAQDVPGNSATVRLAGLAPGEYRIEVDDGTGRQPSPGVVTVNTPPRLLFDQPDVRGADGQAYGAAINGNDWQSLDSGDIDRVINVTSLDFANPSGTLYGRPTGNDPTIVFFTPDAVDTDLYRALCYTLEVAGPRDIFAGSVARLFWGDSLSNLFTGDDIVVQPGVNEYCIGDMRDLPLEGGSTGDWQGIVQWFRLDPHEFPLNGDCPASGSPEQCRDFRLHSITLAPFDAATPEFTLEWSALDIASGSEIDLLLDPDRNPDNGNEVVIATGIAAQTSGSLNFDFSTLGVSSGEYWVLGIISDGINTNQRYSGGPLRLSGMVDDVIFSDGFESP